jgi:tetratricopeptide (TPR) repeat protein
MTLKALCFVDMPFGKKTDPASGVEIDFDAIYEQAIKPAIFDADLDALRGDEERTGGIVHAPMFARLLLSEYVVADLTLANANVFYELGIRHAAKPFTTVPIFATVHPLPFDVSLVRSIPYSLDHGKLSPESAANLRTAIHQRLDAAIQGAAVSDSPLFQLIPDYPGVDLPHEVTEAFQERVKHEEEFRKTLTAARAKPNDAERKAALLAVQASLGNIKTAIPAVLVDLLLSYRDVSAWDEMVQLCDAFPDSLQSNVMVRQQWALALNRRNQPGDRDRALDILSKLLKASGPGPETLGILGRVHKDQYKELKAAGSIMAAAALDQAIEAYTRGFEADPRDYFPGVNAVTLLVERGDLKEAARLAPLVSFAVARRGGAASSDYWDLATVLELAAIGKDWPTALRILPKVLAAAKAEWMVRTTRDNLVLIQQAYARAAESAPELAEIIHYLEARMTELKG